MHGHGTPDVPDLWWFVGVGTLVPVLAYLAAVRLRRARLHRGWSPVRSAAFAAGAGAVGVAFSPPLLSFSSADPRGHMLQHLLLGMYAPLAVVLSAPGTLVLGAAPPSTRRLIGRVLRSRAAHLLGSPVPAAALHGGGLLVLYLTPLYRATLDSGPLHALVAVHFFLAGCLYAWALVGPDPAPRRPGVGARAAVLVVSAALHAWLAKLLYARAGELPPGTAYSAERMEQAAQWMYYGGDLAELALAVLLFGEWYRRRARAGGRPAALRRSALT